MARYVNIVIRTIMLGVLNFRLRIFGWGRVMLPETILPKTMRYIDVSAPGGSENLIVVEGPLPKIGEGDVLVKVYAAGVNRPDILQRMGLYPLPDGVTNILGLEISGEIVGVGKGVMQDLIGQKICALAAGGGYAEYCIVPAAHCFSVPPALSMEEAAAMPETLMTVWHNLFERAYIVDGETVLVHGGTSGIGTMAITLCNLFDVEIIVTCGSDEKCAQAKAVGAHHTINYKTQDFAEEVMKITNGQGVHVIMDMVAGDYMERNIACLRPDGRHVTIAVQGGMQANINMLQVMLKRITMTGSTLRHRDAGFKAMLVDEICRVAWPFAAEGKLKPVMDKSFALEDVKAAHDYMESGKHCGKIVLTMG